MPPNPPQPHSRTLSVAPGCARMQPAANRSTFHLDIAVSAVRGAPAGGHRNFPRRGADPPAAFPCCGHSGGIFPGVEQRPTGPPPIFKPSRYRIGETFTPVMISGTFSLVFQNDKKDLSLKWRMPRIGRRLASLAFQWHSSPLRMLRPRQRSGVRSHAFCKRGFPCPQMTAWPGWQIGRAHV